MDIETIKQQTYELIDRLKKTTVDNGLAGGGNEYTVIIETFLYKFLNDKFIYEAKKVKPELVQAKTSLRHLMRFRRMIMMRCAT